MSKGARVGLLSALGPLRRRSWPIRCHGNEERNIEAEGTEEKSRDGADFVRGSDTATKRGYANRKDRQTQNGSEHANRDPEATPKWRRVRHGRLEDLDLGIAAPLWTREGDRRRPTRPLDCPVRRRTETVHGASPVSLEGDEPSTTQRQVGPTRD
jgi:hypothetical protein